VVANEKILTIDSLYFRCFCSFKSLYGNSLLIPVEDQHVDRGTGKGLRHGRSVADGQTGIAETFDDFADDETVLGISLKNCDAHVDGAGESEGREKCFGWVSKAFPKAS
jgi:hypothetical protein